MKTSSVTSEMIEQTLAEALAKRTLRDDRRKRSSATHGFAGVADRLPNLVFERV